MSNRSVRGGQLVRLYRFDSRQEKEKKDVEQQKTKKYI